MQDLLKNVNIQSDFLISNSLDSQNPLKKNAIDDNKSSQLKFKDVKLFNSVIKKEKLFITIKRHILSRFKNTFLLKILNHVYLNYSNVIFI